MGEIEKKVCKLFEVVLNQKSIILKPFRNSREYINTLFKSNDGLQNKLRMYEYAQSTNLENSFIAFEVNCVPRLVRFDLFCIQIPL